MALGVFEIFLWDPSKMNIQISPLHRFVEVWVKSDGWVFRLVCFNGFIFLIQNLLQVIRSINILLIVDLCVSYLLDHYSLILKLVLRCDCKLSVGCIQTGHTYLLPPQVCGRSWRGWRFLWFHLPQSIHLLHSRHLLKFDNFWCIFGNWFIDITEYCSFCCISR